MNISRDPEALMVAWLDEGPAQLPVETRQAIVVGVRAVSRRGPGITWPTIDLRRSYVALAGAAAVVAITVLALGAYFNNPGIVGPQPSPTPSATQSPGPSPTPSLIARGSFREHDFGPVDLEATRSASTVTGQMTFSASDGWGKVTVDIQCVREADGLVMIGGYVTIGNRIWDSGEPALVFIKPGSPQRANVRVGSPLDEPTAPTDCLGNLDAWLEDQRRVAGADWLPNLLSEGSIELGPYTDGLTLPSPGASPSSESPTPTAPTSGIVWPQSSLEEAQQAQALADAGDPEYPWQVIPSLFNSTNGPNPIVERFLRDELGWDQFLRSGWADEEPDDGPGDGLLRGLVYLRCAPGQTNSLYPIGEDGADKCAPTIDDLRYERVNIDLNQPVQRGPNGIWVVSQWQSAPFAQADPAVARASAESHIEGFLQARVDGQGAEGFVPTEVATEVPLLYTTTGGARFERFEIELVGPLHWPDAGGMYRIRLFAQGGDTVVEQWVETGSGAAAPFWIDARRTTENGQPLAQPLVFMDGQVSLDAPFPWWYNGDFFHWYGLDRGGQGGRTVFHIEPMWHPLPVGEGCATGAEPANAEALAQAIASDPDLVTSTPLPVALNGRGALTLDIALAPGASTCELGSAQGTYVLTRELCCGRRGVTIADGSRMRLWLVDAPTGSSVGILALAIVAPPERFDAVLEAAAPILDTLEFPVP